jgi:hypothetical protein
MELVEIWGKEEWFAFALDNLNYFLYYAFIFIINKQLRIKHPL